MSPELFKNSTSSMDNLRTWEFEVHKKQGKSEIEGKEGWCD